MLVQARKYRTEDKLENTDDTQLNTTQKKQTTQNKAKQNYPGLGNEMGLFYNAPEPSW